MSHRMGPTLVSRHRRTVTPVPFGADSLVIVAYFNFSGSQERQSALELCLASLPSSVDVIVTFHGQVGPRCRDLRANVVWVHVPEASVLWQRERFWNVGLAFVKPCHRMVVWIDADVVFCNEDWVQKAHDRLNLNSLLHLFDTVADVRIEDTGLRATGLERASVVGLLRDPATSREFFSCSGVSMSLGCSPGFAWAARADAIQRVGFPDWLILGSGDKALLAAVLGFHEEYSEALDLNSDLRSRYASWAVRVREGFRGAITTVPQAIRHVVQGDYGCRAYRDRYQLLRDHEFSISDQLAVNDGGAWEWRNPGSAYASKVRDYFVRRGD